MACFKETVRRRKRRPAEEQEKEERQATMGKNRKKNNKKKEKQAADSSKRTPPQEEEKRIKEVKEDDVKEEKKAENKVEKETKEEAREKEKREKEEKEEEELLADSKDNDDISSDAKSPAVSTKDENKVKEREVKEEDQDEDKEEDKADKKGESSDYRPDLSETKTSASSEPLSELDREPERVVMLEEVFIAEVEEVENSLHGGEVSKEEKDDSDDASLSDLENKVEEDGYVSVLRSPADEKIYPEVRDMASSDPQSPSYVMVTGNEQNEDSDSELRAAQLSKRSPGSSEKRSLEGGLQEEHMPYFDAERQRDYIEEDEDEFCGAEEEQELEDNEEEETAENGYYAEDFDEDGFVVDVEEGNQQQPEHDQRPSISLDPRAAMAVALKVITILRKNKVLDGRACGQVKDHIFGGNAAIMRAVEEFTVTHSVEDLVSVIHHLSLPS